MRNLKKVLALALATVMLLGMMAMASAAVPTYNDEAAIADNRDAAIDVLSVIGVVNGSKGNVNPKGTLTKAEAAKIITYLAITQTNADKLSTADAPFADVPADNWAAASIAYCKNLDIISGSQGNYNPGETLNGYMFAKMLLVVLGYDAANYKGDNWSNNVDLDALYAGLKTGLSIDMGAAIIREDAFQMAFNALKADCVRYVGGTKFESNGVSVTVGGTKEFLPAITTTEGTLDYNAAGEGTDDAKYTQLAEKLYPGLSVAKTEGGDKFGYPINTWTYGEEKVEERTASAKKSYAGTAGALTQGALYTAIGATDEAVKVIVNGKEDDTVTITSKEKGTENAGLAAFAGANVDFFDTNANGKVDLAIVAAGVPAKVTKVSDDGKTVDVDAYFASKQSITGITNNGYAAKDWILVYAEKNESTNDKTKVLKTEAAATVMGTMTKTDGKDEAKTALYLDGVAVPVAGDDIATYGNAAGTLVKAAKYEGKKYTVILENGYAVAVEAVAEATVKAGLEDFVYVVAANATNKITNEYGQAYQPIQVVKMDGTTAVLNAVDKSEAGGYGVGIYKVGKDTTTGLATLATELGETYSKYTVTSGTEIKTTSVYNESVNSGTYYTASTKFIFVTGSGAAVKTEVVTGVFDNKLAKDAIAITSKNSAEQNVFDVIIVPAAKAVTTTDENLYYVVKGDVGDVFLGTDGTKYDLVAAYNVKTGAKALVPVDDATKYEGFKKATVATTGVYTFEEYTTGVKTISAAKADLFDGKWLTVEGLTASAMDASAAVIIDLDSDADASTLAKLSGKTITGAALEVSGKVAAIVVTDLT